MRAKSFQKLDRPQKMLSAKARQQLIDQAHEQALKMNAEFDTRSRSSQKAGVLTAAQRACRRKRRYPTAESAAHACAVSRSKINDGYFPVRVYQCDQCSYWHLTSRRLQPSQNSYVQRQALPTE
jgi:hypothetical protein